MKKLITTLLLTYLLSIGTAQNIVSTINLINSLPETERQVAVDSFIVTIEPHGFPYVHYDTSCFIFKGAANSVEVAGGFTNWQWNSINMVNIIGTDFWYYYRTFEMNARLAYKYILNGNNWILDPLNQNTVVSGYGPDSELVMPNYVPAWEIEEIPGTPAGTHDTFSIESVYTGSTYLGVVYLPYNYNKERINAYPVAYFQDGYNYFYAGHAGIVLDNLISTGTIDTMISVFVKPNNRNEEYAGNLRYHYQNFFAEELVSYIDENYNTIQKPYGRAVCGSSLGGNISTLISYNYPEIFGNCGIQAGAFPPNNYEAYYMVANGPVMDIKWASVWGVYDYLNDNLQDFKDVLLSKNYTLHWITQPEGHNMGLFIDTIDELLSFFFPPGFSVIPEDQSGKLLRFKILPNPFTTSITIEYELQQPSAVQITIYNHLGKQIEVIHQSQSAGMQQVILNAEGLPSGVYFCVLKTDPTCTGQTMKMIKLK